MLMNAWPSTLCSDLLSRSSVSASDRLRGSS